MNFTEAIRECKERINAAMQRLNEYTDGIHKVSTDGIGDNAGGVDELGQVVSDLAASTDDLATVVSALDERVKTLEGGKS